MSKKKLQPIEPDVTQYTAVDVLKRATIIIRAITDEEWSLTYDASEKLYSVLEITPVGKRARHYEDESLTEVLLYMLVYKRNPKIAFYEHIDETNVTRISEKQVSPNDTLTQRIERRLRESAYHFDLPDGTWKLTLSELYRNYKGDMHSPIYYLAKVRYSESDPAIYSTGVGLQYVLLSLLLKNAQVIEDPAKYNVVDFDLLKERRTNHGQDDRLTINSNLSSTGESEEA